MTDFLAFLKSNPYPGRGIAVGKNRVYYFIMGRSENSRNRVFVETEDGIRTEAHDPAKMKDPSLIIYAAVRQVNNHLIVTNGNQTDTAVDGLIKGSTFYRALAERTFEPDAPNFTPRISADLEFDDQGGFIYRMSILKSADAEGTACSRYGFDYEPLPGVGHFIHTYECDGSPLPTFQGEPARVAIPDDIDEFASEIWDALDEDNRISLYVRYIDLISGGKEERLINKHGK